tara:strand:- start:1100 stop:1318 length:219 start_codon:yes stop_codon:yes gene_type:complete
MNYVLSFSMKPSSALPIAKLRTLESGTRISITVGEPPFQFRSIVSNQNNDVVEQKIICLQSYWLKATQNQEL